MALKRFMRDDGGSAVQWFALSALLLTVASLAGAQTLEWLSQPGRMSIVAYHVPDAEPKRQTASTSRDIDMSPTGSIPSNALVIRIR